MKRSKASDELNNTSSRKQRQESQLIEQAKRGDKRAISELYRRHVDTIYRYIFARVKDTTVAEDLTAQVFLKALEGLPNYQFTGAPFQAWLYRIAYARTVDYWRQQQRRPHVPLTDALSATNPQPEEVVAAKDEWLMALELLSQLTDDQQDVIILRFFGEKSLSEVAETLGKTIGAIKAIQHRALASLARLWQKQMAKNHNEQKS